MKRQSRIYLAFTCVGAGLFLYALYMTFVALTHYGVSGTAAVPLLLAVVFAGVSGFYAWVAFLFSYRAVEAMATVSGGVALEPFQGSFPRPVVVPNVTKMRAIGQQFSRDENASAFTLFKGAGKGWVASSAVYREVPAREA